MRAGNRSWLMYIRYLRTVNYITGPRACTPSLLSRCWTSLYAGLQRYVSICSLSKRSSSIKRVQPVTFSVATTGMLACCIILSQFRNPGEPIVQAFEIFSVIQGFLTIFNNDKFINIILCEIFFYRRYYH